MKPKVSIIVPCYNVEPYLDRCVQSIVNQTLNDIEIILVDDGSSDNSPVMCDNYAKKDERIKVIHKKNAGLGFARNSGLDVATGEYIAFVDSDDYVDKNMYAELYKMAVSNDCSAVFCGVKTENRNGKVWIDSFEVDRDIVWEEEEKDAFMLSMIAPPPEDEKERKYGMSVWRAVYKRDVIEKFQIRFLSEREVGSEDLPFNVSFLKRVSRIGYIKKNFYYYCYNGSSLTTTFRKDNFSAFINLFNILSDILWDTSDAQIRCDRFFIGNIRSQLLKLFNSSYDTKLAYIKEICSHPIWIAISNRYKPSYYGGRFQRWFYKLLIEKKYRSLYYYCMIAAKIKRYRLKR